MSYEAKMNEVLESKIRETKVKIDILDWNNERKIDSLEGDVISGNISIDGNSALRRTVNLVVNITDSKDNYVGSYNSITGSLQKKTIKDNYNLTNPSNKLSVNKKVKVYIGVKDLMEEYSNLQVNQQWVRQRNDDFVWYQLGIYVITKPTISLSTSSQQISIVLQDKGCLQNGTISGMIDRATRFDAEILSNDTINSTVAAGIQGVTTLYQTLSYSNRIDVINHLKSDYINNPTYSDLWKTDNASTYYFIAALNALAPTTNTAEYNQQKAICDSMLSKIITSARLIKRNIRDIIFYAATTFGGEAPGRVIISDVPDFVKCPVLIPKGTTLKMLDNSNKTFDTDTIAYKMIPYTYPDTLTLQAGDAITKLYDSCNSALGGNYQYYYDVNGYFHFEEIKNYKYNRTPNVKELKDSDYLKKYNQSAVAVDFSSDKDTITYNNVIDYGNIKNDILISNTVDGTFIGYHLVIDSKPNLKAYVVAEDNTFTEMDYREFIVHNYNAGSYRFGAKAKTKALLQTFFTNHSELLGAGSQQLCGYVCGTDPGYYSFANGTMSTSPLNITHSKALPDYYDELSSLWKNEYYDETWNPVIKKIYNYNFEIISSNSPLRQFSISEIGRRSYSKTDNSIKALMPTNISDYFLVTDNIRTSSSDETYKKYWFDAAHTIDISSFNGGTTSGYINELNYPNYGSIYNDAFSAVKQQLFNKTTYNSQVTITHLPYYWLDVNNRAYIYYKKAAINGFYLINKISYNIDENSIMSVSLTEADTLEN